METWVPPEAFDGCLSKAVARSTPSVVSTRKEVASIPSEPSCLWNAMIAPLAGYSLRAVIHNQIESNM
jgi:hypothetical protein